MHSVHPRFMQQLRRPAGFEEGEESRSPQGLVARAFVAIGGDGQPLSSVHIYRRFKQRISLTNDAPVPWLSDGALQGGRRGASARRRDGRRADGGRDRRLVGAHGRGHASHARAHPAVRRAPRVGQRRTQELRRLARVAYGTSPSSPSSSTSPTCAPWLSSSWRRRSTKSCARRGEGARSIRRRREEGPSPGLSDHPVAPGAGSSNS
jgi:hypothetical protein